MKNADDGLLVLAERAEHATAEQQSEILNDAWDLLGPVARWTTAEARRFGQCMDAEAYESAAMMLVLEGYAIERLTFWPAAPGDADNATGSQSSCEIVGTSLERWGRRMLWGHSAKDGRWSSTAAMPALAVIAAALRARYGDRGRGDA